MNYNWISDYMLSKKGVVKDYHETFGVDRYLVGGKMFAMSGEDKNKRPIITLKLEPLKGELLRSKYDDITPGYYMNKVHWNSLNLLGDVPDDIVKEMIDESYTILFNSLTNKAKKEIV